MQCIQHTETVGHWAGDALCIKGGGEYGGFGHLEYMLSCEQQHRLAFQMMGISA